MLDIRKRTGYLFLAVMMAQVILVSAQVQTKTGVRLLQSVVFELFSHVQFGTASTLSGGRNAWGSYVALRGVRVENEALKRRVADLEVKLQQEHALAARSQQLQALMDLKSQATVPTLAAEVIAGNPDPVMRTVIIDRGSADGVLADMAVIAPGGIVGRIIGPLARHAARVQLIIDRNAAAGALIERTRAGGMIVGAEANPALRMDLVSSLADVKPGDAVVASGVDGIYPKGYAIGRVEHADPGGGLYRTITVKPGVDFSSLEEVLVVLVVPTGAVRGEDGGK
jgi:rod shape-determining protein MreC